MRFILIFSLAAIMVSCKNEVKNEDQTAEINTEVSESSDENSLIFPGEEKFFKSLRQVTFGGDNAEAYWSPDGSQIIFQSNYTEWGLECDQMFIMNADESFEDSKPKMVSTGKGRTTCGYFMPDGKHILYSSTHLEDENCPPVPERVPGRYVWPLYDGYEIFVADLEGNIVSQLTDTVGYNAEATVSPQGDKIVFTSTRTGDLELFTMDIDGSNVKQITHNMGYDGGAFFSPDGSKLVFRAHHLEEKEDIDHYKGLLKEGLIEPSKMEIFVCDADGSNMKQITNLGQANWAPFFHPSGEKIIFSSNFESERGFPFHIYMIDIDGSNLTKVTNSDTFDSFPMFSPDGKHLIFSSNRNNSGGKDTNIFIAEWQE